MLTQTADHALRALLAIARHGGERPLRVDEVAELTGAPRNYLGKTLGALVKAGLLRSARGPLGGFTLAVDARAITVTRVADLFTEPRAPRRPACVRTDGPDDPRRPAGRRAFPDRSRGHVGRSPRRHGRPCLRIRR